MSDSDVLWEYNCLDCVTTAKVWRALREEMDDLHVAGFYEELVHPLTLSLRRMAGEGMWVDQTRLRRLRGVYAEKERRHVAVLRDIVGRDFNPNSSRDVGQYLFVELGLKSLRKTATGKDAVDELTLLKMGQKYDSPFFKVLLSYRKMAKLRSTYLTKVNIGVDGRVRSRFLQHGTATGRLSSRDPNFQNIPYALRTMYAAEPGNLLGECDASQLELRLIAYASNCVKLIEAFERGDDVHRINASAVYNKPPTEITKEERDFAKRFIYCQNYGGSARRISEILFQEAGLNVSVRECEETLFKLKAAYPEIWEWRDRVYAEAKRTRCIRNEFGRVRVTFTRDEDLSGVAYNTPIQSTAADYINYAFLRIMGRGVRVINQVHDAIVWESSEGDIRRDALIVKEELERPVRIFGREVVLPVDLKVGRRWGALKKMEV